MPARRRSRNAQNTVDTLLFCLRDHAAATAKQPFIDLMRQLVQKVVVGKTPGHQPATILGDRFRC